MNIPYNLSTIDKLKHLAFLVSLGFLLFIFLGAYNFSLAANISSPLQESVAGEDDLIDENDEGAPSPTVTPSPSPVPVPENPIVAPSPVVIRPIKYEMSYLAAPTITSVKINSNLISVENFSKNQIKDLKELYLEGKGVAGSDVYIFFHPEMTFAKTKVDTSGKWKILIEKNFKSGDYLLELKLFRESEVSKRTSYSFAVEKNNKEEAKTESAKDKTFFLVGPLFIGILFGTTILGLVIFKVRQIRQKRKTD